MVMANGERASRGPSLVGPAHERAICEIRTLDTVAELTESYRLRYEVYSKLGYLRRFNKSKLEIDGYDSLSIPCGAFDPVSGAMIGTLRLITTELQPEYDSSIRHLLAELGDEELTKQALAPWSHPLPSIISDEMDRQIEAFNTERFVVHEVSRLIVHPNYRGSIVLRSLVEFGLAHAARLGPAVVIGSCLPMHLPLYARFGCQQLPHTRLERFESVGQIANMVVCRTDKLTHMTQAHVDELLRSMESGATEYTFKIGHDSSVRYRTAPPRRARRLTRES